MPRKTLSRLPEHPTPAMIDRGVQMHRTARSGTDETLVHDIWQAMYDEWQSESTPPAASDLRAVLSDMANCIALDKCNWQQQDDREQRAFCSACGSAFNAAMVHMAARVVAARAEGESAATERCAQIAETYPGHPRELTQWEEPVVRNIAGAIRASSPTRKVE